MLRVSKFAAAALLSVSAHALCIGTANASSLENVRSEDGGSFVSGEFAVERPGIYTFAVGANSEARVAVNGATVIDPSTGVQSASIALSQGSVEVTIETPVGRMPSSLTVRPMGGSATELLPSASQNSPTSMSVSPAAENASTIGDARARNTMESMVNLRPTQEATAAARIFQSRNDRLRGVVEERRGLRSRLRERLRERAVEVAVSNRSIARATINGELSDYVRVGQRVSITATPSEGREFVRWAGDVAMLADPMAPQTDLTVGESGANVFAVYRDAEAPAPEVVTLPPAMSETPTSQDMTPPPSDGANPPSAAPPAPPTVTAPPNSNPSASRFSVSVSDGVGSGNFVAGSRVVVRANTPPVGQGFRGWSGDVSALADPSSPVTILTVPNTDVSVSPTFGQTRVFASTITGLETATPRGATITGRVTNPQGGLVSVEVLGPTGSVTGARRTVPLDPTTGNFAARIFEDEITSEGNFTVIVRDDAAGAAPDARTEVNLIVSNTADELEHLLSRITFGATPAMMARARSIGYEAFVEEQLNPASINNAPLDAINPDGFFEPTGLSSVADLRHSAIGHAIYTERQLEELLTNFWENHFYTTPQKLGPASEEFEERTEFRRNSLGGFRNLLEISAKSPVMSAYLDNRDNRRGNGNENYARELLELHTVGVNSSYTEEDIVEVAKVVTGWRPVLTNDDRQQGDPFFWEIDFFPNDHDTSNKFISFLNLTIDGREGQDGAQELDALLDALAAHPDTARFICGKLTQFFVADTPPPSLVSTCSQRFLATDGSIREVVRTILLSDEFRREASAYHSKYKTPFEAVVALVRTLPIQADNGDYRLFTRRLEILMNASGYDPFVFGAPTGLPEVSGAWTGAASVSSKVAGSVEYVRGFWKVDVDERQLLDRAPARTAEGVAAYLCQIAMHDRCVRREFEEIVGAVYGEDGTYDPAGNDSAALHRAMQVTVATISFNLQ